MRLPAVLLLAAVLTCAAAIAYSTSFPGVFLFDDRYAIVGNPNIRTLWPLTTALSAPPESPVSARPVASLSLALNYALAPPEARDVMAPGGTAAPAGTADLFLRNVWGYHFVNLSLHVLAGLALFGVVRRTLLSERLRERLGAASTALAFATALLWLVHPVLTDAVTYVAQRTEGLMGLFFLVTLYCAIRAGYPGLDPTRRRVWSAGAILACALGMGSKQTMALAPLVVWLWDWTFGPPGGPGVRPPRRALYASLAATWALLAVLVAIERWPTSVGLHILGWSPWTYLLTQTRVILHYVRLAVVPFALVSDYDGWPMARSLVEVAPFALALALAFGATVVGASRRNGWAFLGAWFFATLAPSSSLLPLPTEVVAERRLYLPLAAIIAGIVIGGHLVGRALLAWLVPDGRGRRLAGRLAAVVLVAGAAVTLSALTYARNRVYWSEERFWQDVIEKRPSNPRARLNYGVILSTAGRREEAAQQLREAVRLRETDAAAHANLGSVLCSLGRFEEGVPHLERALALDPGYTDANGNLGEAYGAMGRLDLAARYFSKAVDARPRDPFLLTRLGWLLATSPQETVRDGAKAVRVGERAVLLTSRQDVMALDALAAGYAEVGRFDDAVRTVREALALAQSQGNRQVLPELGNRLSLYEQGKPFRESP